MQLSRRLCLVAKSGNLLRVQQCGEWQHLERDATVQGYAAILISHLEWAAQTGWPNSIETIYFGGGTPSLLCTASVAAILTAVDQHFKIANDAEISLEANPGTVSLDSLTDYRSVGINRLSLGLQSCEEHQLRKLGRLHTSAEGNDAIRWARQAGFDNISIDLMFSLPGQTHADLQKELCYFLKLGAEHLSCYGLTAEADTPLHQQIASGKLSLPADDFYSDAFMQIHERLASAGYAHYEIANYAQPGHECRHNLNYWKRGAYLGVGAGAHSFRDHHWGSRWEVPTDVDIYQRALHNKQEPMTCLETFDEASALRETVYLALRTRRGITDAELLQRFNTTLQDAFPEAIKASAGWLYNEDGRWSLTPSGWLLFDRLILPFL